MSNFNLSLPADILSFISDIAAILTVSITQYINEFMS